MMKRKLFLTVVLCFVSICVMGQSSGTYTAKKTKVKTVKTYNYIPQFEKGWYLRPEIGVNLPLQFEVLCGAGYQINPFLYVGLGTGIGSFHAVEDYKGYIENAPLWYSTTFPLFATVRVNFLTTKSGFTPFFETKMGYTFGLWGSYFNYNDPWGYSDLKVNQKPCGFYGHWGIGGNYKNLSILLSYHILGYDYDEKVLDPYYNIWHEYDFYSGISQHFSISVAYTLPLKKKQ
ncbi:MAG: hypothetical protein RBT49_08015 [Bacteroidales bacterium]|nr:hypothetical protein [Bacteroidales bacterium]